MRDPNAYHLRDSIFERASTLLSLELPDGCTIRNVAYPLSGYNHPPPFALIVSGRDNPDYVRLFVELNTMFDLTASQIIRRNAHFDGHWRDGSSAEGLIVESWSQGCLVGALFVMACITIAAMRRHVLLHKLILVEQLLAITHGTFCFMAFPDYGWYVSSTAVLLYCSYFLHNVVAWLKVRPFFVGKQPVDVDLRTGKIIQIVYYTTLGLTIPVWIFNMFNNFRFNNNINDLFERVRAYEFLVRDPWWLFTNIVLLRVIGKSYGLSVLELVRLSPRLGILLASVIIAICFTIIDLISTILRDKLSAVDGINPYWKLSLLFKCLTDAIMLDDFATELKRIGADRRLPDHLKQQGFADEDAGDNQRTLPIAEPRLPQYPAPTKRATTNSSIYDEIEDIMRDR